MVNKVHRRDFINRRRIHARDDGSGLSINPGGKPVRSLVLPPIGDRPALRAVARAGLHRLAAKARWRVGRATERVVALPVAQFEKRDAAP